MGFEVEAMVFDHRNSKHGPGTPQCSGCPGEACRSPGLHTAKVPRGAESIRCWGNHSQILALSNQLAPDTHISLLQ